MHTKGKRILIVGTTFAILSFSVNLKAEPCSGGASADCKNSSHTSESQRIQQKREAENECRTKGIPLNKCFGSHASPSATRSPAKPAPTAAKAPPDNNFGKKEEPSSEHRTDSEHRADSSGDDDEDTDTSSNP